MQLVTIYAINCDLCTYVIVTTGLRLGLGLGLNSVLGLQLMFINYGFALWNRFLLHRSIFRFPNIE